MLLCRSGSTVPAVSACGRQGANVSSGTKLALGRKDTCFLDAKGGDYGASWDEMGNWGGLASLREFLGNVRICKGVTPKREKAPERRKYSTPSLHLFFLSGIRRHLLVLNAMCLRRALR